MCLTGGEEGVLTASLSSHGYDEARKNVEMLTAIFGKKNVYIELQRHCDSEEERRNQAAVRLAETLNLPLTCNEWRSLRDGGGARTYGCLHLHPQSHEARNGGTAS